MFYRYFLERYYYRCDLIVNLYIRLNWNNGDYRWLKGFSAENGKYWSKDCQLEQVQ